MAFYNVTLMNPKVLCGMFAGVLLVFLFSAMTMKAVGRAAKAMVKEVRRQFREIPGIMEGTGKPDYARCVAISTAGAQREMVLPSLLALVVPIVVGLLLDVAGVLGLAGRRPGVRLRGGDLHGQRRRRLGQRQEVHRDRPARAARAAKPTRPPSSATPSATRSRTPPARRLTSSSSS